MLALFGNALGDFSAINGLASFRGLPDLRELPVQRFCDFIWYLMIRDRNEGEVASIRAKLWMPPPGVEVDERSPWHPKNQLKSLMAARAAQAGGGGATS